MNYKLKAKIQNLVNLLPSSFSYPTYYWIQKNFGGLRKSKIDPTKRLEAGIETCKRIEKELVLPLVQLFWRWEQEEELTRFWLFGY